MPLSTGLQDYVSFVKGLVTEATPLTFPVDASIDEENFDILNDGSRARRLGIDLESANTNSQLNSNLSVTDINNIATSVHIWNTNLVTPSTIIVVQLGQRYWFFNGDSSVISLSQLNSGNTVTLPGDPAVQASASSIAGYLVVANGQKGINIFRYNEPDDEVDILNKSIDVRDIWGVDDYLEVDNRPSKLTAEHEYNLRNQGWPRSFIVGTPHDDHYHSKKGRDPIDWTKRQIGVYPSNADIIHSVKGITQEHTEAYLPDNLEGKLFGTTAAPKGKHIIDLFQRGLSRQEYLEGNVLKTKDESDWTIPNFSSGTVVASGNFSTYIPSFSLESGETSGSISNEKLKKDSTDGGVMLTEFFAGRLWLACEEYGIEDGDNKSPNIGTYLLFSQVVDNIDKINKFYQDGDPTSEVESDIVASDGGVAKVPGIARLVRLISADRSLIVFANNGIWEVSGAESNFTATDYEVTRITKQGTISKDSIVNVDNNIFYWTEAGIYVLSRDQVSGRYVTTNITDNTIKTRYNQISSAAKENARGVYDFVNRKILWLYNNDRSYTGPENKNYYNTELVFNIVFNAFSVRSFKGIGAIGSIDKYISGSVVSTSLVSEVIEDNVYSGGTLVQANTEQVVISEIGSSTGDSSVKYLTLMSDDGDILFTFSKLHNPNFKDWERVDGTGTDASAFMLTGYEISEDTQREKQSPYLTFHMKREREDIEALQESYEVIQPPPVCGTSTDTVLVIQGGSFSGSPEGESSSISFDSGVTWTQEHISSTTGSYIRYNDVFATVDSNLLKVSNDYGDTWNTIAGFGPNYQLYQGGSDWRPEAIYRIDGGFILSALQQVTFPRPINTTLFRSTDSSGAVWTAVHSMPQNDRVRGIFKVGSLLYMEHRLVESSTTYLNPLYSDDNGDTWGNLVLNNDTKQHFRRYVSFAYGNGTYMAICNGDNTETEIWRSSDGITWNKIIEDLNPAITYRTMAASNYLSIAYANDRWAVVALEPTVNSSIARIFTSSDNGDSWTEQVPLITNGLSGAGATAIRTLISADNTFYGQAEPGYGTYKSCDCLNWVKVNSNGPTPGDIIYMHTLDVKETATPKP